MDILNMSIAGGVLIVLVIIVRALCIGKLPKWTFLALWGVALYCLIVPYALPVSSMVTVREILPSPDITERHARPANSGNSEGAAAIPNSPDMQTQTLSTGEAALNRNANDVINLTPNLEISPQTIGTAAQQHTPLTADEIARIAHITIALLMGGFIALTHIDRRRQYAQSLPLTGEYIENWRITHPLRRRLRVREYDRIGAPITYGIFRPTILVPKSFSAQSEAARDMVLEHEYTHVRRFDAVMKLLIVAALCAHWFNPLVWAMAILANRDIELACDDKVVRRFGEQAKATYALMLIDMQAARSFSPLSSGFNRNAVQERIVEIMNIKKRSMLSLVMAILLVVTCATAFATTNPTQDSTQASNTGSNELDARDTQTVVYYPATEWSDSTVEYAMTEPEIEAELTVQFKPYKQFGITYDASTDALYFNGEHVRYFEDMTFIDEVSQVGVVHEDELGSVDVYSVRDSAQQVYNEDGTLNANAILSFTPYSQAEYDARIISFEDIPYRSTENISVTIYSSVSDTEMEILASVMDSEAAETAAGVANVVNTSTGEIASDVYQGTATAGSATYDIVEDVQVSVAGSAEVSEGAMSRAEIAAAQQANYAKYAPLGLTYNAAEDALYFDGKKVRYFEDMYPVDGYSTAGTVWQRTEGEIDVHTVRDLSQTQYNADGSTIPGGVITGIVAYSQEETDAHTRKYEQNNNSQANVPVNSVAYAIDSATASDSSNSAAYIPGLVEDTSASSNAQHSVSGAKAVSQELPTQIQGVIASGIDDAAKAAQIAELLTVVDATTSVSANTEATTDAASIGIIGGADGPTSIFVAGTTAPQAVNQDLLTQIQGIIASGIDDAAKAAQIAELLTVVDATTSVSANTEATTDATSAGVIGGADSPATIFITDSINSVEATDSTTDAGIDIEDVN